MILSDFSKHLQLIQEPNITDYIELQLVMIRRHCVVDLCL